MTNIHTKLWANRDNLCLQNKCAKFKKKKTSQIPFLEDLKYLMQINIKGISFLFSYANQITKYATCGPGGWLNV